MRPECRMTRSEELSALLDWNAELYNRRKAAVDRMWAADSLGLGVLVREYKRLEAEKAEYVHSVQQLFLADVFQHCARQNTEGNIDAMLCPGRA